MLKHLEISNPTSCLNQSQPDEPVFVICGRDPLAAEIIREWAVRYIAMKGAGGVQPTERQAVKYHEALRSAELAIAWRESKNMRRIGDRREHSSCPTCYAVNGGPALDSNCPDPWHRRPHQPIHHSV